MANRTDTQADTVHGGNPQFLVDRIVRVKIYNDAYWKEFCFALTTETIIDRAAELDYVCGTYGGRRRPAKFLCLILKMLQIQPDEDVIMEYIKQPDLKYLRALGIAYLRLTSRAKTIYQTLEPLYADYRKLRYRNMAGKLSLIHMDELVDWLLTEEVLFDITLPQLPKREVLEFSDMLEPRQSVLEDDLEDLEELEAAINPKKSPSRSPSPTAVAASAETPAAAAVADADEKAKRSSSPHAQQASPARRRSRGRSGSAGRKRSRSPRRQTARRRSRSRHDSEGSRGSEGRRDKKKEKGRKEKEKEKDQHERKDKKEKKEKKEAEEREVKAKKDKKEQVEEKKEKKEKKEKDRGEPVRKKGLFKGDEKVVTKEKEKKEKASKKEKDGLSTDAWNEIRKELGLKPLGPE